MYVIKKDGTLDPFNPEKIKKAITKSANRVMVTLSDTDKASIVYYVRAHLEEMHLEKIPIQTMHSLVEKALEEYNPNVAKSYRDYRNYKQDFIHILDEVYMASQNIRFIGDKENANTDSTLVATKRCLIFNELNKRLYRKFFMTKDELQACKEGYIYIHDQSARLDTMNCCLCDAGNIMRGGFEMANQWYEEPKTVRTAFSVLGDIILSTASQQYGGFTVPEIDKIMSYYAEKSYKIYVEEWLEIRNQNTVTAECHEYAMKKVEKEIEQGYQGIEMKLNTVGSSRGDYPFITFTFGLGTERFEKMTSKVILRVHKNGQGKKGFERPVLFPKLVLLYDEELHGVGCVNEDIFNEGIDCSCRTMYPDWLSLTGEGYVASMYKKYKRVVSPMGCRAFLSPYYERGGFEPADESDKPVFVGRFNIGAVSLNLPMILAKSRRENRDFYEVLDYYLEMIRNVHCRTYDYLGEMKASVNPVMYCEGGFYEGNLEPHQKIKENPKILESATASFGFTALNELQRLYNGKSIREDGQFALDVLQYINDRIAEFKKEDHHLYAMYGTPAENLCGLQIKQFRAEFGIIENVSDRPYVSNSFHCHVAEDMSPIEKQDKEKRFWDLSNGGKIQYVRYPLGYNRESVVTLVRRAMKMGFYEGVNLALCYCKDCGFEQIDMGCECPKCKSHNIFSIDRMNGYLAISRNGSDSNSTRLNEAVMANIKDRKSM